MAEYENGKWERSLPFPLKDSEYPEYSENNTGDMPNMSPDFFPDDDQDEIIDLHFRMSLAQFTAIASAIDIGRDIGYGERSYELWRTWCKALIGEITVSCEDIADCIDTDETVQNSITNQINTNISMQTTLARQNSYQETQIGFDADTSVVETGTLDREIKSLANCDKDALWAGIRDGILQRLDDNARQLLEVLVSKVNLGERATSVIGAIPSVGAIAEAVLDQLVEIMPDLLDSYNAYSSIVNLDNAACDIFGLVCEQCRYPTNQELYDYFASLGDAGLTDIASLTTTVAYGILAGLTTGTGIIVWHSLMAVQMYTLLLNEKFASLAGIASVAQMASFGEELANDNWETLCDACVAQYSVWNWDFALGQGDWIPTQVSGVPQGVYEDGAMAGIVSGSTKSLQIELPLDASWRIIGARVEYEITNQTQTIMRYRQYFGTNTNAVNPSISNCTDTETGYRWSFQGTDIDPPSAPVTDKRSFWLVLTTSTNTSTLKVHKVWFEFEFGFSAEPSFATEETDYLWCP